MGPLGSGNLRRLGLRLIKLLVRKLTYLCIVAFSVIVFSFIPAAFVFTRTGSGFTMGFNWAKYWEAVGKYLETLVSGSLGEAVRTWTRGGRPLTYPVADAIEKALPRSLTLLGIALTIAIVAGVIIGLNGTHSKARWYYGILLGGVLAFISAPDFLVAMLSQRAMILLQSAGLKVLPPAGYGELKYAFLPAIVLSLVPTAYIARVTSVALDGILHTDYIRTAVAKGCSERQVIYRHALKNAALQIIDSFPALASISFSNLAIVEYIFYVPGAAYQLMVTRGDAYLTAGLALCFAAIYFAVDLLVNILREFIDPRLKEVAT